tara:strand:- start:8295 stop:8585 length:291 start_codon:yes stop_codon:yes gene_type:complete
MEKRDDENRADQAIKKIDSLLSRIGSGTIPSGMYVENSLNEIRDVIIELQHENESLWFMLDEIRDSDIEEHSDTLNKALEQIKLESLMKNMKPVEA